MRTESILYVAMVLSYLLSCSVCASERTSDLVLNATIVDDVLVAELLNDSADPLLLLNRYQSIDTNKTPGFFVEVVDQLGRQQTYCGMLDQGEPSRVIVQPKKALSFKVDTWIIKESHCLRDGEYNVRVVYVDCVGMSCNKHNVYSKYISLSASK